MDHVHNCWIHMYIVYICIMCRQRTGMLCPRNPLVAYPIIRGKLSKRDFVRVFLYVPLQSKQNSGTCIAKPKKKQNKHNKINK